MKPLPVYSIELRFVAPMALAAAASRPPSCAWLWLAIARIAIARTRAKPAVIVRYIVASLQEDSPRPVTGLLDSCPRAIPPHRCASRKANRGRRGDRPQRPLHEGQTAIEPYFRTAPAPCLDHKHPDHFHQEPTNGDKYEVHPPCRGCAEHDQCGRTGELTRAARPTTRRAAAA